jgi:alpha-tubulin suppressor-like RCC1 family protein
VNKIILRVVAVVALVVAIGFSARPAQAAAAQAWGYNDWGQLGDSTTTQRNAPVPITTLSSGVSAVAGGRTHSLAVRNGAVYGWGHNYYGQVGEGTTFNRTAPVAISTLSSGVSTVAGGLFHSLAVQNGAVYSWGHNDYGQLGDGTTTQRNAPVQVPGLSNIVDVAAATIALIPEPTSLALLGLGAMALLLRRR